MELNWMNLKLTEKKSPKTQNLNLTEFLLKSKQNFTKE